MGVGWRRPCGSVHARDGLGLRMPPTTDGSITRVEVFDYRCLRRVCRRLRPFQVLVGPNGSGKSSFVDAIALVCDLQQTSVEGAVYGDYRVGVPMRAPDARHLTWMREGERFGLVVEARIPDALRDGIEDERLDTCRYECVIDTKGPPVLVIESLWLRAEQATYEENEQRRTCVAGWPPVCEPALEPEPIGTAPRAMTRLMSVVPSGSSSKHRRHDPSHRPPRFVRQSRSGKRTSLSDYALESPYPAVTWFSGLMAPLQRISLSGEALRRPSPPSTVVGIGPHGGNLANLIHNFAKEDTARFRLWIRHVREALPEIKDIRAHERPEDHHRYLVVHYRNGLKAPSWIVSEGTLRLLALTSLAYAPLPPGPCVIEEPENGIHPTALETVVQSLSSAYDRQVLLATHSPLIATLADPRDVLCFGHSNETGTTVVCGHEHPRLENWQGRADLGTLLASGVL